MLMRSRLVILCTRSVSLLRCSHARATLSTQPAVESVETSNNVVSMPDTSGSEKVYSPKIVSLVDSIAQLTLLEVSELNSLLKSRLNISDAPLITAMPNMQAQSDTSAKDEEEEQTPTTIQTVFTLRLESFDASKKVGLIKELKAQIEDMNLVQAKKFVESAPAVIKADIAKEEAETLKKKFEEAGAQCVIE